MVQTGFTRRGERKLQNILQRLGSRLRGYIADALRQEGAISTGALRDSYRVEGRRFTVIVGTPLEYGLYVEFGTGPRDSVPPFEPIKEWVQREIRPPPQELESVTWAVMQKIKQEGTPAQPHVRPAVDRLRSDFR